MIELTIPGRGPFRIQHLVMDVNGTLAVDGQLMDGLAKRIASLRDRLDLHLVTADLQGHQTRIGEQLNLNSIRIKPEDGSTQKADYIRSLGPETVSAIGQGADDAQMLKAARLGVCVISKEGVAIETLLAADLLMPDIFTALDLFDKPLRIVASLRK